MSCKTCGSICEEGKVNCSNCRQKTRMKNYINSYYEFFLTKPFSSHILDKDDKQFIHDNWGPETRPTDMNKKMRQYIKNKYCRPLHYGYFGA